MARDFLGLPADSSAALELIGSVVDMLFASLSSLQCVYTVTQLSRFFHLDTIFNMYGPAAAIAMPYVLWSRTFPSHADRTVLLRGVFHDVEDSLLGELGRAVVYERAENGQAGRVRVRGVHFLDQLVEDGLLDPERTVWVGGPRGRYETEMAHLAAASIEQRNLAANVFCVGRGRVLASEGNTATLDELAERLSTSSEECHLYRLDLSSLARGYGGPHCLVQPFQRSEPLEPR